MKIGLFHGYNLGGSGSNEYTRYLAKALHQKNAEIHLICREPAAESLGFIDIAIRYDVDANAEILFEAQLCPCMSLTSSVTASSNRSPI